MKGLSWLSNPTPAKVLEDECSFHSLCDKATHNTLLEKISSMLTMLTKHSRLITIEKLLESNQAQYLIDVHNGIYNVIKDHDKNAVKDIIEFSYQYWSNVLEYDCKSKQTKDPIFKPLNIKE